MAQVIWTAVALEEVDEIAEHIAQDNPEAAARVANRLFDASERLQATPEMGTRFNKFGRQDTWQLIVDRNYRLIYRYRGGQVDILAAFHTSRLLSNAWKSKLRE